MNCEKLEEVEDIIYNFVLSYSIDRPKDLIPYAAEYFDKLKTARRTLLILGDRLVKFPSTVDSFVSLEDEDEDEPTATNDEENDDELRIRRRSVSGTQYNPEEEMDNYPTVYPKLDDQRFVIKENLKRIPMFKSVDDTILNKIVDAMYKCDVFADENLYTEGHHAETFYIVESGIFHSYKTPEDSDAALLDCTYSNSGHFGELALLYDHARPNTIKAITNGTVWALSRYNYRRIMTLASAHRRQLYGELFEHVSVFGSLSEGDRWTLAEALVYIDFQDEDVILKEGDRPRGVYFVEKGNVVLMKRKTNNSSIEIIRMEPREWFADWILFADKMVEIDIKAEGDVTIAYLDMAAYDRLFSDHPRTM